ncbi:MAG TPA: histidine phosphatase family protein, partial [Hyphomonas sp.]
MARLIIVRHGNTFDKGDTVTRVGGRTDLPLSASGLAQADALANHFADTRFVAAFCSPLMRTRQTARAMIGMHTGAPA